VEKISPPEEIDHDRRRLFGTAAMTIAAAGTSSFVAAPARAAAEARFTRVAVELSVQRSSLASKSEDVISLIDQALKSNEQYAKAYNARLGAHPQPAIAVVTCMDPRLSDLEGILGLKHADMDVIRNGGPAVTDEVLAGLVVSTRVLGSKEIMLLNHTGCGFTTFTDEELNAKLSKLTGDGLPAPMRFLS
jgi:carbonic anhydrase